MKKFEFLSTESVKDNEQAISKIWEDENLLEKCVSTRDGGENFIFYEGPPTANGKPGIHHVIARTLKDSVCRYKTMQGYKVKRKAGWDTHGLPVEIEVEKQLKLTSKTEIESYGIAEFNKKCRESVFSYEKQWRDMTNRMAYAIDLDNPYITLDNNYIESEWWILKEFFKKNMIYEGHKILPYCPRCGTGLASHEVAQGYKEVNTLTITCKFKLVGKDNEYFLAWTTTPWTTPANVALAVHPDLEYVKVKQGEEIYYVAKALAGKVLKGDYEEIETLKGSALENIEYEQLLPFIKPDKKAFYVVCAPYVTAEDGTGIVHTAPAFGEDDYQTGRRYNLPVLKPVGEDGKFYGGTPWDGRFVMEEGLDIEILKLLVSENKLYSKEKMMHNYPHCWRCQTPLIYYAKPSWYIEVTKIKDEMIAANKKVEWYPDYVGEKRFGNWLENLNDWALSRSRYWGTPLNLWTCECGHIDCIGSRAELVERAIEKIDETIELHRPYVDDVHIKCEKCGKTMNRVPDVIDCWFDSGAMPYAQHHYPFENKEIFDSELFPADYICEGIDQTRGWFYSLLAISTFVKGVSPYKRVLVNDLILDKEGRKMSKSKGNTVDPFKLFDQYGADALRWYLLYVSPAWTPTKFDEEGLKEVLSKFFGTLKNVYAFFALYANTDEVNPKEFEVSYSERPELDRWMLSKLNNLCDEVERELSIFDLTKAVRKIQHFVAEDLSNWYIRRSRRRFWETTLTDDKKSVYKTTYEVLEVVSRLIAPFAPFLAEEIFTKLTGGESVHLEKYPVADKKLIDNDLEHRMDLVRDLVGLGRAVREKVKIKVRQPISQVMLDGAYESEIAYLVPLIKEELNVKEVVFASDLKEYMNFTLKPDYKKAGALLGSKIKSLAPALLKLDSSEVVPRLEAGETITVSIDGGETLDINKEFVEIKIIAKQGFDVEMEDNKFIIIDTTLTPELLQEGYAREFISKIQQMRKSEGLEMMDKIAISYNSDTEIEEAVDKYADYIKKETLAISIAKVSETLEEMDLNEHKAGIKIAKA